MPISGVVIRIAPEERAQVVAQLNAFEGLDLPEAPAGDTLVAVIDAASMREEEEVFKRINDLPGVTNVTLSYHNFEDISEQQSN